MLLTCLCIVSYSLTCYSQKLFLSPIQQQVNYEFAHAYKILKILKPDFLEHRKEKQYLKIFGLLPDYV